MSIFNPYQIVLFTLSLFCLFVGCTQLNAQQSINASGGDGTGNGSFSYSIGQVLYTATESTIDDASIIQGVQVPFEFFLAASCQTDFNFDGTTNGLDFAIFLGNFDLTCAGCPTDLNGDGITNGNDFSIFLGNFGLDCN